MLIETLRSYKDVFAWSYRDLKGVDPTICQHTIPIVKDAKPTKQRPYTYNETFARKIKKEIDKLKEAKFIYEIEHTLLGVPYSSSSQEKWKVKCVCEPQKGKCNNHKG